MMAFMRKQQVFVKALLLVKVCVFFFFNLNFLFVIINFSVVETQPIELCGWLNDLNNSSILCETISDVSIIIEK